MHSLIGEQSWVLSNTTVNTLRGHYMWNEVATAAGGRSGRRRGSRPSVTTGQNFDRAAVLPAHAAAALRDPVHDGGPPRPQDGRRLHLRQARLRRPLLRERAVAVRHRRAVQLVNVRRPGRSPSCMQTTGVYNYDSHILAAYLQDDWRLSDKLTLNLGLRYDLDTNLRMNDVYDAGARRTRSTPASTTSSAPTAATTTTTCSRASASPTTSRGDGTLVARAGWGMYVTRHRHYFGLTAAGPPARHRRAHRGSRAAAQLPEHRRVLGGKSLADYVQSGAARSLYVIPDDYVLPQSQNTTAGFGWQINGTTGLDVDFVHAYGYNQLGAFDLNLPASGRVNATQPAAGAPVHRGEEPRELHQELVQRARDPAADAAARRSTACRSPTRCRAATATASTTTRPTRARCARRRRRATATWTRATTCRCRRLDDPAVGHPGERHRPRAERHALQRLGRLRHRRRRPDPERPAGRPAGHRRPRGRRGVAADHQRAAGVPQPGADHRGPPRSSSPFIHRRPAAQQAGARSAPDADGVLPRELQPLQPRQLRRRRQHSIISPALLVRNAARDPRQVQLGARVTF